MRARQSQPARQSRPKTPISGSQFQILVSTSQPREQNSTSQEGDQAAVRHEFLADTQRSIHSCGAAMSKKMPCVQ